MNNLKQGDEGGYLTQASVNWMCDKKQKNLRKSLLLKTPFGEKNAEFIECEIDGQRYLAHTITGTLYKNGRAVNSPYLLVVL